MTRPRSEVIPSARRLIHSLRDLGYDLSTAVADLIDNSIAAGATTVSVETCFEADDSWIRIVDDGDGMTRAQLHEAMRFGTRREYEDDELGKFGLGLKAASLSQCRCLTVASRSSWRGRVSVAQWDLDYVEESDRWEVLHPTPREVPLASDPLRDSTGTVVVWEDLDRIFRYRIPDGKHARNDFNRLTGDLAQHLSMVFPQFLRRDGARRAALSIVLNGAALEPWDPFATAESETLKLPVQRVRFVHDATKHLVTVRSYVLPAEARFSSPGAHRLAAGPRLWNRQQGFYIYRAGRMIQSGGWNRLRTSDEHTKLARVRIDLPSGSDELFELNISKTQVRIPSALRPSLAAVASNVTRLAQTRYRAPAPAQGPVYPIANRDPRVRAIRALVRMVVQAVQTLLAEEVSNPLLRDKVSARLLEMEDALARDLDREVVRSSGRNSVTRGTVVEDETG